MIQFKVYTEFKSSPGACSLTPIDVGAGSPFGRILRPYRFLFVRFILLTKRGRAEPQDVGIFGIKDDADSSQMVHYCVFRSLQRKCGLPSHDATSAPRSIYI